MRRLMRKLLGLLALVAIPSSAHALSQTLHRAIAIDACKAAKLPSDFCARVGTEIYNVDKHEWNDMPAHAQADGNGDLASTCAGANKAVERERTLAADIRKSIAQLAQARSK